MLMEKMASHWWVLLIRGIAALFFGILTIARPGISLAVLIMFFGAYSLVDGIFAFGSSFSKTGGVRWGLLLEGIVGVLIGLLTFFLPGMTAVLLLVMIAVWAILTGILEIVAGFSLKKALADEWLLILGGLFSIVFGGILLMRPLEGAVALALIIGVYAVVFGAVLVGLAFKLNGLQHGMKHAPSARA